MLILRNGIWEKSNAICFWEEKLLMCACLYVLDQWTFHPLNFALLKDVDAFSQYFDLKIIIVNFVGFSESISISDL